MKKQKKQLSINPILKQVMMLDSSLLVRKSSMVPDAIEIMRQNEADILQIDGIAADIFQHINGKLNMHECLIRAAGPDADSYLSDAEDFLQQLLEHKLITLK